MKRILLLYLILVSYSVSYAKSDRAWPSSIINTVQNNASNQTKSFSKNFLTGKLDSDIEFGAFHRKIGNFDFKTLNYGDAEIAPPGDVVLNSNQRETTWFVPVYESGTLIYRCRVECVTTRYNRGGRFKGHEWDSDCGVTGLINK